MVCTGLVRCCAFAGRQPLAPSPGETPTLRPSLPSMPLPIRLFAGLLCLLLLARGQADGLEMEDFGAQLEAIRRRCHLPALSAAAVVDGRILLIGATGVRQADEPHEVTVDDSWHLGSCTKSMTATLAAMLVEEGKIQWTITVGEVFPELRPVMNDDWEEVTLEQLLSHTGGAPAHAPDDLWMRAWQQRGTPTEQRLKFMGGLITRRPETAPGTKFVYSNQGYAIAGAMLERVTGEAFEQLITKRIFEPLGMHSAGFGAPGQEGEGDQPWGHSGTGRRAEPVPPGPQADNPPAISPAGRAHCSIADLARYAAWHAAEGKIATPALKPESFAKLHTQLPGENYALGWVVQQRKWGGGKVLMHTGSNTMWYCVVWIAPGKNAAFVAATNCNLDLADNGCDAAIKAMVELVEGKDEAGD